MFGITLAKIAIDGAQNIGIVVDSEKNGPGHNGVSPESFKDVPVYALSRLDAPWGGEGHKKPRR
jgi:hypothetical protein